MLIVIKSIITFNLITLTINFTDKMNSTNRTFSAECQAGTYASEEGTSCLLCPIGMYQPSSAATSCIECEEGTTTESAGSEELGECIGRYLFSFDSFRRS